MVDTGGGFRDATEFFWEKLKVDNFDGGRLFDDGENVLFMKYNNESNVWKYPETIGKALFWCWIHQGAWPTWIHPMHLTYIIDGENQINVIDVLKEYIPYLYNFVIELQTNSRNNNTLILWANSRNVRV